LAGGINSRLPFPIVSAVTESILPLANTILEPAADLIGEANLRKVDQLRVSSTKFDRVRPSSNPQRLYKKGKLIKTGEVAQVFFKVFSFHRRQARALASQDALQWQPKYRSREKSVF
jgi:hypothetical protein